MSGTRQHIWNASLSDNNRIVYEANIADAIFELREATASVTLSGQNPLSPIPQDEAEVQSLRYLRGFIIIANTTTDELQRKAMLKKLNHVLKSYGLQTQGSHHAKLTYWLADQFAKILSDTFNITEDATRAQVTMARDLGILLEDHHPIRTDSTSGDVTTTQLSMLYKVRPNQRILRYKTQPWFIAAKKMAGVEGQQSSWLDIFFEYNAELIAKNGVPSLPSARWLPTPANLHESHIITSSEDPQHHSHTSILRMGTVVALDFKNTEEQQKIAYDILYEIISDNLKNHITLYRKLYNLSSDERIVFFVNYQTLLSPLPLEGVLPHKDNNAYFVATTKNILRRIRALPEWQEKFPNTTLITSHTNAAINKHAWRARSDADDTSMRRIKVSQTKKQLVDLILKNLKITNPEINEADYRRRLNKLSPLALFAEISQETTAIELLNELRLRANACEQLTHLLDKKPPFATLAYNQYNLMMAALEFLTMGRQSLAIGGCKSGRDRTAFFLAAVKTMQEDVAAMRDWDLLEAGIVKTLEEGHHFRAMSHHSAVVKVGAVLEEFLQKLSPETKKQISGLKKFSKPLKAFEHEFPEHTHYSFWSLFKPADKIVPPQQPDMEDSNEHNSLRASGNH